MQGNTGTSGNDIRNMPISERSLLDLMPNSLLSSPIVSISTTVSLLDAMPLLSHNLESFTDSLVVTQNEKPVGIFGGIEILDGILKNQSEAFLEKTKVNEVMSESLIILSKDTTLGKLINQWMQTRRAFAIIPNQYQGYSVISARKLLKVGMRCKTQLKVGDISHRKIITFRIDQTVREIISSMFENKTRKLILEGTSQFISDRVIVQTIVREQKYLRGVKNFLDMKANIFQLERAKEVSDQLTLPEACMILYEMNSPYLLLGDGVLTPWDVVTSLASKKLVEYS